MLWQLARGRGSCFCGADGFSQDYGHLLLRPLVWIQASVVGKSVDYMNVGMSCGVYAQMTQSIKRVG